VLEHVPLIQWLSLNDAKPPQWNVIQQALPRAAALEFNPQLRR